MGKLQQYPNLQSQQIQGGTGTEIFFQRCAIALRRIVLEFNFKCVFVLILSIAVFVSAIFWLIPLHSRQSRFDANDTIRLRATVQAYFTLQKPVSLVVPQIARLEYDIFGEIGVPFTKVSILSLRQAGVSNWTDVVFGFLSNPIDKSINPVSLSVLRSSFVELFLQQINLTLTNSIFGQPSSFKILKFPGGITIIPEPSAFIWVPQTLFNFTLYNSIYEIKENLLDLKEQLKLGLHLKPYENVYVQVTNKNGSTRQPPVTVQASVMSNLGGLLPQRLKQLAQTITGSPAKNLGLNNTVFGRVKEISLSSYLNCTLNGTPPTPSPAPSPDLSPYPALSPSNSPAPSPGVHHSPPCSNCDASSPHHGRNPHAPSPKYAPRRSLPPISSTRAPSNAPPPRSGPGCSKIPSSPSPTSHSDPNAPPPFLPSHPSPPLMGSGSHKSPDLSPLPAVSYGSTPFQDRRDWEVSSTPRYASHSSIPASSATSSSHEEIGLFVLLGLVTIHLLCWS